MSAAVRERVWGVVERWQPGIEGCSVVMTWPDASLPGGQDVRCLGVPRTELRDHHGVFLSRRAVTRAPGEP